MAIGVKRGFGGGGGYSVKQFYIFDATQHINNLGVGRTAFQTSGDIDWVNVSEWNYVRYQADGQGGKNSKAYSNRTFNTRGYKTLCFTMSGSTAITNYGGVMRIGLSDGFTAKVTTSKNLNTSSWTFDGSIDIRNLASGEYSLYLAMTGTEKHYSNASITKIWLEK